MTRGERVLAVAERLVESEDPDSITSEQVRGWYADRGLDLSTRQVRYDLSDARELAAEALRSGQLPHWTTDVSGGDIRACIGQVIHDDHHASLPQIRAAVVGRFNRSITDSELKKIARRAYEVVVIGPRVEEAQKMLETLDGSTWRHHQARDWADPLSYRNPFGTDPEAVRSRVLVTASRIIRDLEGRQGYNASKARVVHSLLRLMLDTIEEDEAEAGASTTLTRIEQLRVQETPRP